MPRHISTRSLRTSFAGASLDLMYTDPTVHKRYLEGQNIAVKLKKMHTQTLIIYVTDWHLYSESRNEKKVSLQQTPNSLAEFINKRTIWYDQRYSLLAETNKHTDTKREIMKLQLRSFIVIFSKHFQSSKFSLAKYLLPSCSNLLNTFSTSKISDTQTKETAQTEQMVFI